MATFTPGHLHLQSLPLVGQQALIIDLHYGIRQDPEQGTFVHFRMRGAIEGEAFEEVFELPRDTAFNFASLATRIAVRHGLRPDHGTLMFDHRVFDLMFEDIREKLHAHSGEPVDLERMLKGQ